GAESAAAQGDQDEGTLPQRGGREEAHLSRHRQRRAGVDANAQLDDSPARVQDPLRRPTPGVTSPTANPPTRKIGRPPRVEVSRPLGRWLVAWFWFGVSRCGWLRLPLLRGFA